MTLPERMQRIGVESAFDVLMRARALEARGRRVIHLEIGEPDFPTPAQIVEAAKRALDEGWTHYGPPLGLPELREAVADYVTVVPGFPICESMIRFLGAVPVPIPLIEERGFSFDLDMFRDRIGPRTKMVVLNSPQNPTGGVIPRQDMAAQAEAVGKLMAHSNSCTASFTQTLTESVN